MAETSCPAFIRAKVMRITKLDSCGNPVYGDCGKIVTDGFIKLTAAAVNDDGDAITRKNGAGRKCIDIPAVPEFTRWNLSLDLCGVDPDLMTFLTGQQAYVNAVGDTTGFFTETGVLASDSNFAIELWTDVDTDACAPGVAGQWGYFLFPFVQGGVLNGLEFANDALDLQVTNMATQKGALWDHGPYFVEADANGNDSWLFNPVGTKTQSVGIITTVAPPEPSCGCSPLSPDFNPLATTATAGNPGMFGPFGARIPANLAELQTGGVVASPNTVWGVGEYVELDDNSHAYWDGAGWVAGEAP